MEGPQLERFIHLNLMLAAQKKHKSVAAMIQFLNDSIITVQIIIMLTSVRNEDLSENQPLEFKQQMCRKIKKHITQVIAFAPRLMPVLQDVTSFMNAITTGDIAVSQIQMTPSLMWDWNQTCTRVVRDMHQQLQVLHESLNECEMELSAAIIQLDRFNNPHAYSETEQDSE